SFEGRRIIAKAVTGISGKLRLDAQLQPVGEPVFELVNGGLAVAEHKIVLELELMRLDYRAADLEVLGFGLDSRGGNDGTRSQDRAADPADFVCGATETHVSLLTQRSRIYGDERGGQSPAGSWARGGAAAASFGRGARAAVPAGHIH